LISSIFRVKKSNSNPKSKLKFKPKRPKYGRNRGFEFEFCTLNLSFKTIKTKNYIELINPAFGRVGVGCFYTILSLAAKAAYRLLKNILNDVILVYNLDRYQVRLSEST
jgi:hypothetical protein